MLNIIKVSTRKKIAIFLFILAVAFLSPPAFPFGEIFTDLFLNLPVATFISKKTNISLITSLILTYTLIPLLLLWLGSWIYPSNTMEVFNSQFTKIKNWIIKYWNLVKNNPKHLLWLLLAIFVLYKIYQWYASYISINLLK